MIQMQTMLDIADNSGAKTARCIKVLGGTHRRTAGIGDTVVVSIQKAIPGGAVKSGQVAARKGGAWKIVKSMPPPSMPMLNKPSSPHRAGSGRG